MTSQSNGTLLYIDSNGLGDSTLFMDSVSISLIESYGSGKGEYD